MSGIYRNSQELHESTSTLHWMGFNSNAVYALGEDKPASPTS